MLADLPAPELLQVEVHLGSQDFPDFGPVPGGLDQLIAALGIAGSFA
jgi:hypothetical protein